MCLEHAGQVCFNVLLVHECEDCTGWPYINRVSERKMLSLLGIIPRASLGRLVNSCFLLSLHNHRECGLRRCRGITRARLVVDRLPEHLVLSPGFETNKGMPPGPFEQIEVSYNKVDNTTMVDSYRVCAIAHYVNRCHYTIQQQNVDDTPVEALRWPGERRQDLVAVSGRAVGGVQY